MAASSERLKRLAWTAVLLATIAALAPTATAEARDRLAWFSDPLTLRVDTNERVRVRPYDIQQLEPDSVLEPDPGNRWVGVWVSFKNVGRRSYRDNGHNAAKLVTRGGTILEPSFFSHDECAGMSSFRVPRRQVRRGCILFEVPVDSKMRYFEWNPRSGYGVDSGIWRDVPQP